MLLKANQNFPIEIESIILSRLPVKSLIRFRSVCKSWYSLISDSYFINLHRLQNQKENLFVLQIGRTKLVVADTCFNERLIFEKSYYYDYNMVDSCNGLVCVYGQDTSPNSNDCDMEYISLWNPALGINKTIHHGRMNMEREVVKTCVGFGFHNQINDYKVIRFSNDFITFRLEEVEIYSLSSDSWRNVKGAADSLRKYLISFQYGLYVSDAALTPNYYGAYYWLANAKSTATATATANAEGEPWIILFDVMDEVFKEIMLPSTVSQGNINIYDLHLFNLKESLGVLEGVAHPTIDESALIYMWVMKEYNEPKSWTKLHKFQKRSLMHLEVLGTTQETELVLQMLYSSHTEWNVLDVDKLQINTISIKDISLLKQAWRISPFTESLVLLELMNKQNTSGSS